MKDYIDLTNEYLEQREDELRRDKRTFDSRPLIMYKKETRNTPTESIYRYHKNQKSFLVTFTITPFPKPQSRLLLEVRLLNILGNTVSYCVFPGVDGLLKGRKQALGSVPGLLRQNGIHDHQSSHGLNDRHSTRNDTGVVSALGGEDTL